ncbi:SAV_2336 family protein [Streptomyces sp. NBC_01795]|uniref:SAV_2336 N-terminal domain-related protein n=1 Tax=Streptomyces sp. NBC_01795 TaxID=2975943 RepID=UPI002DDC86DE|nr:SAV_2336 N-terminal domain-related protein [Streptomyces sp. NBC_01795]WSA92392.1 SAV_2336 family protein [Streptomyces sp. NBC_01795]
MSSPSPVPPPPRPTGRERSSAGPRPDQLAEDLAELVARLRATGWEPSSEEVAEAVWLARWTGRRSQEERDTGSTGPRYPGIRTPHAEPSMPTPADPQDPAEVQPMGPERTAPVSLYAPRRHGGATRGGFPVRAPAAGALSGLLQLQHALRPLHGYRPPLPPSTGALDEEATADLSARSATIQPVFGTEARRYSEIQLLMDASATASVWQPTLERLRQTFEQLGAFRDVQVRYLHRAKDGSPLIGTGPADGTTRLRPADEYRDTTGRRLTLVVSDCVGPLWQDGRAQRLLHHWSGRSPLAVIQPLPPRLWPRTALPAEAGTLVRERGAGGRIGFRTDEYGPRPAAEALPVPVLLPTPEALGNWARLLGGGGERAVPGAAAWVLPRHPAMPPPRTVPGTVPPRTLLRDFRNTASPGALDLAVHLAVVPLLLPVIHLVQEAMLPDTGPMELAEVLLSGLLERLPDRDETSGAGPRYTFAPGVRELLLQSLDQGAAVLILKHLSGYVAQRFGKGTRNFAAVAVAQLTGRAERMPGVREPGTEGEADGTDEEDEGGDELFAEIPAEVVRFYLPEQSATDQVGEAERLLRQWRAQGDAQLLHQARSVAEAARAAEGDSERARLALAQVLHALAGTAAVRRTPKGAESLLRDAAVLLTGDAPATSLERAAVEHDLWQVQGGTGHLLHAERLLRALEGRLGGGTGTGTGARNGARDGDAAGRDGRDSRTDADGDDGDDGGSKDDGDSGAAGYGGDTGGAGLPEDAETTRKLRLGRVLLALAHAAPEHRPRAAPEAVSELREASDMLADRAAGGPDPSGASTTATTRRPAGHPADAAAQRCAALLDLVAALRLTGAAAQERLDVLQEAAEAAGERSALRLRCARERARTLRETGGWEGAAEAYAEAVRLTAPDGVQRGELLSEWGEMLLTDVADLPRAESILREALTRAPSGPVVAKAAALLGRVLLLRYERGGFRPDLYEGCHLLEQAARQDADAEGRAQAWLRLGRARALFPAEAPQFQQAGAELTRALEETEERREGGSATAARALHARGDFQRSQGRTAEALADYRAAAAEWQVLANHLADVPWAEVRETRERVAELAG